MFSFFKSKQDPSTPRGETEKEILARLAKERRQRKANEAYRRAIYEYHTMPEVIKNENMSYARKKGILNKYSLGPYHSLPLAAYKEFEQEVKDLRAANARAEAEQRRLNNEAYSLKMKELQQEIENERRMSMASDPRPPSPFGGKQTRKRKHRKHRKATKRRR